MMRLGVGSPFISLLAIGASVPLGMRGLVHVWGRNDMATTQQMGVHWIVRDPDGLVIQEYFTWEAWPYTVSGGEHGFMHDRFDINKPGNWTITIELLMNSASPVTVDSYDGILCVVTEEYAGAITRRELEYDETWAPIPVS